MKYFKNKKTDVLLITLNKSDKDYSPTTLYNDYAISSRFFHWQSQPTINAVAGKNERFLKQTNAADETVQEYRKK